MNCNMTINVKVAVAEKKYLYSKSSYEKFKKLQNECTEGIKKSIYF